MKGTHHKPFLFIATVVILAAMSISNRSFAQQRPATVPSYRDYVKSIQRIFASEAAKRVKFTAAVQSARLLGILEFVDDDQFVKLYPCLAKGGKDWDDLNAKQRENVIDECKVLVKGRQLGGAPVEAKPPARPPAPEANILTLIPIQDELSKLSSKIDRIESILTTLRSNQDNFDRSLREISRSIAAIPHSVSVPRSVPPQPLPEEGSAPERMQLEEEQQQ
ncbi:MAG: hypothetical protein HY391_04190 [Deltaproteobacteria bacterium]|nr:hypothetical protein [Deltaproteobacteria bacterium]